MTGQGHGGARAGEPVIEDLIARIGVRGDAIGEAVGREVRAGLEDLSAGDPDLEELLHGAAAAGACAITSMLRWGVPPTGAAMPARSVDLMRALMRGGHEVTTMLRVVRVGHRALWRQWARVADDGKEDCDAAAVGRLADLLAAYVDEVADDVVRRWRADEEVRRRSGSALREEVVRRLLAGDAVDVDDAGRDLGYELRRNHVALVLRASAGEPASRSRTIAAIAADCAARLGDSRPLCVPVTDGLRWIWASSFEPFTEDHLRAVRDVQLPTGVAVGFGSPGAGGDGFVDSHTQAAAALRVARARPTARPTAYGDVALLSVLLTDPVVASRFARTELGPLASGERGVRTLRATLATFLAEGGSYARSARRIGVHEKTVVHRIRRAEKLLGTCISGRRATLEAALLVWDVTGGDPDQCVGSTRESSRSLADRM